MKTRKITRTKDAVIITSRQLGKDAPMHVVERRLKAENLPEHVAEVQVDSGVTRNIGNYESARIGVSIRVPCAPDEKSIKRTYREVSRMLEECMDEECERVLGE